MKRTLLILIIIMCAVSSLSAKQIQVAVLPLQARDCSLKIATEATYILKKYLEANKKTVVDSKTLETVMTDFNLKTVNSEYDAKRLMKYIQADDLVHGTITKESSDAYAITLYVLEKRTWRFQSAYMIEKKESQNYYEVSPEKSVLYYKLKEAIARKLSKTYLQKEVKVAENTRPVWYSGFIDAAFVSPAGRYAAITTSGYGLNLGLAAHDLSVFSYNLNGSVRSGMYYFAGTSEAVQHVMMVPLTLAISKKYDIWNKIALEPVVAGGFLFSFMSHDDQHYQGESYQYTTSVYVDMTVSFSLEVHYAFSDVDMLLAPSYGLFFERDGIGQMIGLSLGARYRF